MVLTDFTPDVHTTSRFVCKQRYGHYRIRYLMRFTFEISLLKSILYFEQNFLVSLVV